jgi:hypothetical protein
VPLYCRLTLFVHDVATLQVVVKGKQYGQVTLATPLKHYHHAEAREYQCEVGFLSRNIKVEGNEFSEPTDVTPLACDASVKTDTNNVNIAGWDTMHGARFSTEIYARG